MLNDIAQAVGGFVYSDPQKPQLTLAPRWKVAAWNLNNTTEIDVSLPENVIVSISGQSTKSAPCYGVFVAATHENGIMRKVVRKGSSGSPEASALSHALYTADAACIAAATAALSQTGDFKTETLSLPICADFALNRANLGEIWRVSEDSSTWNGIVQSVNVSVDWDNDAPRVMQSVQLRRYLSA